MLSDDILLRNRGDIVGFGKYVIDPSTWKPTEVIHGHSLDQFARESEHLVAVHSVQIFKEFEENPYPYLFKGFDDPPTLLGDLNDGEKSFKTIIAWDDQKIAPNPRPYLATLGPVPKTVSAEILNPFRQLISNSPVKLRFSYDLETSKKDSHQVNRERSRTAGPRSALREIGPGSSLRILESLPPAYESSDDDSDEEKRMEGIMQNFLSRHELTQKSYGSGFGQRSGISESEKNGNSTLSAQEGDEIEKQIPIGRFDESIDQHAEEEKAEEEREDRRRAHLNSAAGSNSRSKSGTQCNSSPSASDPRLPSGSKRHISTDERVSKRLRVNGERVLESSAQNGQSSCNSGYAQHSGRASGCTEHIDPSEPPTDVAMGDVGRHGASEGDAGLITNAESTQSLESQRSLRQTVASSLLTARPSPVHIRHEATRDMLRKKRQYRYKTRQRVQKKR